MNYNNFLQRLKNVQGRDGQWTARCPAHDDRHNSLSVSVGDDGRILLNCHAGCRTGDIVDAMGLKMRDLFPSVEYKPGVRATKEAEYIYNNGKLKKTKMRQSDGGKYYFWQYLNGNQWEKGRNGIEPELYIKGDFSAADTVFIVEGEKDVETMAQLGYCVCTGADGAGHGKWKQQYTEQLTERRVVIIGDNDKTGTDYAGEVAAVLYPVCPEVCILDLKKAWPEIPEHGDVSDFVAHFGVEKACEMLYNLEIDTSTRFIPNSPDSFITVDNFEEQEASWLVPGWIPEKQVTVLASDGGVGKTSLWVNIAAAVSRGGRCILDPIDITRKPQTVLFVSAEDSVSIVLKKKLREADAKLTNIRTIDQKRNPELFRNFKFGSPVMEQEISKFRPALVILDPLQAFLPPTVNMGSRNQMRDCLAPLITIGEKYGTTFLIIAHSNKRKGAAGRDRLADSADLWDIARSVIMGGFTQDEGIRYLSNEKNNYGPLKETVLFSINDEGRIICEGTTWKRDRDFILDFGEATGKPRLDDCKDFIISTLKEAGGEMLTKDLDKELENAGHKLRTVKRAKKELKDEWTIRYRREGKGDCQLWYTVLEEMEENNNF